MQIVQLDVRRFRGFFKATIRPTGHVVLVGEPRAGRSDIAEALSRVLSAEATRLPLGDDLDFFGRDRTHRAEVEVILGGLGPELEQRFFDHLEFWDKESAELVDEADGAEALDSRDLEPVVRLCYRAE